MTIDTDTHTVPWFTRRNALGQQSAACEEFVDASQIAPVGIAPTCWGCANWIQNLDFIDPRPAEEQQVA